MSSEDGSCPCDTPADAIIEDCDDETLRIMVSTDNHLGYLEDDPVRGDDSFAALEEVLFLARKHSCDMVLLAGDLFHENKPSRLTLFKTMNIFRHYCMGGNAVSIQILSDQKTNFRRGFVNYQDEFCSIDLPVMSIHGNHDSPANEGTQGSHLLAALDLLDSANLVNYIGQQGNNKEVEVSPVLIKKGNTHIALYGLGSMREERLNRLWQTSKFTFLRPADVRQGADDDAPWFNLFALHQNRNKGRGSKNCVHESMIPEWMDLVIWGHEHECLIEPQESVVGTFRISQPGSSVATSLVAGESVQKKIGLLDIRGTNFRLRPIPLTQVRTFAIGEVSLAEYQSLNPDDPKVEEKVKQVLKEEVELLVHQAKQKAGDLLEEARKHGNLVAGATEYPLENHLRKPQEVLVRLKVEHAGFSAVNNHRFGAGFVGEIANTSDILLFQRKKSQPIRSSKKKSAKSSDPIIPEVLEDMNIEDFIVGELDADNHLDLFDESRMALALDEYVAKEQAQAINDSVSKMRQKQQNTLIKQGHGHLEEVEDAVAGTKRGRKNLAREDIFQSEINTMDEIDGNAHTRPTRRSKGSHANVGSSDSDFIDLENISSKAQGRNSHASIENESDFLDKQAIAVRHAPSSRRRASTKKSTYMEVDSDGSVEVMENPSVRKTTTIGMQAGNASSLPLSRQTHSQAQRSFVPVIRNEKAKRKRASLTFGPRHEEDVDDYIDGNDVDEDWGTAKTDTLE